MNSGKIKVDGTLELYPRRIFWRLPNTFITWNAIM